MNFEASLHSLLSFAWTLTRPTNFNFVATKYCFLILKEDTSFFFLIISLFFVFFCYFTLPLIFTKIILLSLFYYIDIFFHKDYFYFSCSGMFWDVPGCSRMFWNVPGCSMFWVLSTPAIPRNISFKNQSNNESLWKPTFGYGKSILLF